MVRFSCFNAHIHPQKPKKTVQLSGEAMQKALEDDSKDQRLKDFTNSIGTSSSDLKVQGDTLSNSANHVKSSSSSECDWKSEEIKSKYHNKSDIHIKKSKSLGSELDAKGRVYSGNDSEDETCQEFSCDGSHDQQIGLVVPAGSKDPVISLHDQYQEALASDSFHVSSDMVNNDSIFSIGDPQLSEKEVHENPNTQFSGECAGVFGNLTTRTPLVLVKSSSSPNIGSCGRSTSAYLVRKSKSSEDLNVLGSRQQEIHEVRTQVIQDQERDESVLSNEKNNGENPADDSSDTYKYVGSAKDWIIPVMDEVNMVENLKGKSSVCHYEELPNKDFKIKRIEQWVIDLQHCTPLEETNELSTSNYHRVQSGDKLLDYTTAAKLDGKVTPGMEASKKYLSSLAATSTTAQLANHGLVVIPFLSAFVSLRTLNLSGNAIVRMTAGALPRGLHILNLSKNNISTIEGLRELTRLRVLDLSYNRIFRIGHGLASCSSVKELYLAGNKISEAEGLHRLLKLNVLDLRFNKISTAKCLGQLAANYNSLQAISLEGNPAQKNVGDEQLKKYLQALLPHLAYFNRQSIKLGTLKDAADRSARLGISAHQIDRGLRSEKTNRKGTHGIAAAHSRRTQAVASPKPSKGRHGRLPPSGITTTVRSHFYDVGTKLTSFRPDLAMHRSRSEGTLGAL